MEDLDEPEIGSSISSFQHFINSQKDLLNNQIDQLQQIVVAQCKLTGVNPLSQEMAAGALSIKIGKKPRDLLNPKAVSYMQAVFSIKDAITKKECKEISAQFGISATLVRDFFNGQRTRLRKFVRVFREKASIDTFHKSLEMAVGPSSSFQVESKPLDIIPHNAVVSNSENISTFPMKYADDNIVAINSEISNFWSLEASDPCLINRAVPLISISPAKVEEEPSCSLQNDIFSDIEESEKHFVKNIFDLLRKEETFTGQVKLLEWVLRIENSSVLNWFLLEGGAMILTTWLGLATAEEQTSIILIILKVLCHLPLQNSLPEHMSAILQSVNGLRYYRSSDISNRARILLSKWSKMFARSQAMKRTNGTKSFTSAQETLLKQSIEEIMGDELWQQLDCDSGSMIALPSETSDNFRKIESSHAVKLLTASSDDQTKKQILGISASNAKKRRKVQLVDQQGITANKSSPSTKLTATTNVSRPMSADDIQKAKIRALYKQNKLGKSILSVENTRGNFSKSLARSKNEDQNKIVPGSQNRSDIVADGNEAEQRLDSKQFLEICHKAKVQWQTPPEILLNDAWRVGCGESGKEADTQKNRNRREMEIFYCTMHDIPLNAREPWDHEMDYDDTLTPEIPVEQQPDIENEDQLLNNDPTNILPSPDALPNVPLGNVSEPDLELLAALLKNPELVFALTSGQTSNLSNDETVRLLDMIKMRGAGGTACVNGTSGNVETKAEVSLPSPTPSHNPGTSGWRPEVAGNPFSRPTPALRGPNTAAVSVDKQSNSILKLPRQAQSAAHHSFHQSRGLTPERQTPTAISQGFGLDSLSTKNLSVTSASNTNFLAGPSQSRRLESARLGATATGSVALNSSERQQTYQPQGRWLPPQHTLAEPLLMSGARSGNVALTPSPDSWSTGQSLQAASSHFEVNRTNYDFSYGGQPERTHLRSGSPWERNQNVVEEDGFETWSPERNSSGSARRLPRRSHGTTGVNQPGWHQIVPNSSINRSRQNNQKNEDMRWR